MYEGAYAKQRQDQLQHDLDSANQDIDELRCNIEKVVIYMSSWPEELAEHRIAILKRLSIGKPLDIPAAERDPLFQVETNVGKVEQVEPEDLLKWAAKAEQTFVESTQNMKNYFNNMKGLAARENMREDDFKGGQDGDVHKRGAPDNG